MVKELKPWDITSSGDYSADDREVLSMKYLNDFELI